MSMLVNLIMLETSRHGSWKVKVDVMILFCVLFFIFLKNSSAT